MKAREKNKVKKQKRSRMTVQAFCTCPQPDACFQYCDGDGTVFASAIVTPADIASWNAFWGL